MIRWVKSEPERAIFWFVIMPILCLATHWLATVLYS